MTKELLKKYYEMQGKVVMPQAAGENHIDLAASIAANLVSIGFPLPTTLVKHLAEAKKEDIQRFYQDYYAVFSEVIGAGRHPEPFYPDFPEGCMERSEAEYFIDQVIYGLSGLMLEPRRFMEEKKRFPFIGQPMRRVVQEGSMEDLKQTFELTVSSAIAYSKAQRDFMLLYAKEFPQEAKTAFRMAQPKNRENNMACACMLEELTGNSMQTKYFIKQPVDVLRYAAYHSAKRQDADSDAYAAISLRYATKDDMPSFSLSRPERVFIMDMLASMCNGDAKELAKGMAGHDAEWRRLLTKLHIKDQAWAKPKYDFVKEAISMTLSGVKVDRPARHIEEAIKAGDTAVAVKEAAKMPGDFMRRFDKLYRMAIQDGTPEVVLSELERAAERAGIATVTGMIGNVEMRDHNEELRYFKGKNGKIVSVDTKNRKAFTGEEINNAVSAAMNGLKKKFAGKEPIGKVYMTDAVQKVKIPADIRDNSGAIGQLTSGSKMTIPKEWNMLRFFISWTNMPKKVNKESYRGERIDIDLTVAFCDKDMNIVGFCGWNGSRNGVGCVYSGDVQDGGPANGAGRAEYIDVDFARLKEIGVRYMVPQVNSFTEQPFSTQPNTFFGVMARKPEDFGELYEPKSVVNRFILDVNACQVSPYVIDLEAMEILWLNETAQGNVASRGLQGTLTQMGRAAGSKTMSLSRLIEANAAATGEMVKNPAKADVIFVSDVDDMAAVKEEFDLPDTADEKFILSNNMAYITGYLMQEQPDRK